MSVINKMLQDLDSRQNGAPEAMHLYTKPAAFSERRLPLPLIAAAVAGAAVIAAAGVFGWRYWHKPKAPVVVAAPAKVVIAPPPPVVTMHRVEQQAEPAAPAPAQPAAVDATAAASEAREIAVPRPDQEISAPAAAIARAPEHIRKRESTTKRAARGDKHDKHAPAQASDERKTKKARPDAADKAPVEPAQAGVQGKEATTAQKAEAAYRRGLTDIQEGYASDAVGELELALQANPHHDAARQTLVGLLIESKRFDEAMRQLQLALTLDARQPAMAMLLARLQIERGGTGIDTLMRSLPYVGANGEYRAFLAGALQRQQRHREAVEQYQAALRSLPQNGVWLMGLAISLQAEKRDGEALDAFRKAKASGTLNQQLASFVDAKIAQLTR